MIHVLYNYYTVRTIQHFANYSVNQMILIIVFYYNSLRLGSVVHGVCTTLPIWISTSTLATMYLYLSLVLIPLLCGAPHAGNQKSNRFSQLYPRCTVTTCLDMSINDSLESYSSPMEILLKILDCIGDNVMKCSPMNNDKCSPVTVLDDDGCHVTKKLQGIKQHYSIRYENNKSKRWDGGGGDINRWGISRIAISTVRTCTWYCERAVAKDNMFIIWMD